ncbi:MAG TPA: DUF4124 domain-containing protein [Burkholderiaceae bacterium]|nr:DUF4124 domain-containing protein [Burkholderiaceae bacterium]
MTMKHAIFLAGVLWLSMAQAADIYQWVDESGRTHLSDAVPEKYKHSAKRVDSRLFEVSPQQRAEAEARAAREREQAMKGAADAPVGARGVAAPASAATPASAPSKASDCATLRRQYAQSQECFAPFMNTNGSIKPGAFEKCTQLPDPSPKCGPEPSP